MADPVRRGRLIRPSLIIPAIVLLLGLVLWLAAPHLIRQGLLLAARAYDLDPQSLEVRRVGWRRIEIADVVLGRGGDIRVGAIHAAYSLQDLVGLHLESVLLADLRIHALVERKGLAPGALATLLSGRGGVSFRCDEVRIEGGVLDLDSPLGRGLARFEGRGALPGAGEIEGEARFTLGEGAGAGEGSLRGGRGPEGLRLRASARADEGRLSLEAAFGPAEGASAGRGRIRLAARGARLPGLVSDLRMDASFDFSVGSDGFRLWSPAGARARAAALDAGLLERLDLPRVLRGALADTVEITLDPADEKAPLLQGEQDEGSWRIAWDVEAAARAGRTGALEIAGRGSADLAGRGGAPPRIAFSPLKVWARGWDFPAGRIDDATLHLDGEGTLASFAGDVRAGARGSTIAIEDHGNVPVDLSLRARLSLADGVLRVTPRKCMTVNLGALRLAGTATAEPLALCLEAAADGPLLALGDGHGGWSAVTLRAVLRPTALRVRTEGNLARLGVLEGETPAVTLALEGSLPRAVRFRLEGEGGRLLAPGFGLEARDARLDLAGNLRADPELKGTWRLGEIAGTGNPPLVAPLSLSGGVEIAGREIVFSAGLTNRGGGLSLRASGRHALESGEGSARVELAPLRFGPRALRPRALLPALGRRLGSTRGSIDASGTFRWGRGFLETPLRVRVKGFSFETEGIEAEGVEGVIRLQRLVPPRSRPGQVLQIARVESGVALTGGRVRFGISDEGRIEIEAVEGRTLGGALAASGWVDWRGEEGKIAVRVGGLKLADLLALIDLEGLTGYGELDGRIPIEISARRIFVRGARFEGTGEKGWIRYRPRERPRFLPGGDERVQLVLAILDDFRYDSLGLGLEGPLFHQIDLAVDLSGSNPDVEADRPVEFHLRVSGYLLDLLRGATASTRISETLGRRLRESGPAGDE